MGDRRTVLTDRERAALEAASRTHDGRPAPGAATPASPTTASGAARASPEPSRRPVAPPEAGPRGAGAKFGAATDGWDAYNSWLDRVRQPPPPSRQAVIAKSLGSLSSYKSWADKARGAFDPVVVVGGTVPAASVGKAIK